MQMEIIVQGGEPGMRLLAVHVFVTGLVLEFILVLCVCVCVCVCVYL